MIIQNKQDKSGIKLIRPSTIIQAPSYLDAQVNPPQNDPQNSQNQFYLRNLTDKKLITIKRDQMIIAPNQNPAPPQPSPSLFSNNNSQLQKQNITIIHQKAPEPLAQRNNSTNPSHLHLLSVNSNGYIDRDIQSMSPTALSSASFHNNNAQAGTTQRIKSRTNLINTIQSNPYQAQIVQAQKRQKASQSTGRGATKVTRYQTIEPGLKQYNEQDNRAQSNPKQFMSVRTGAKLDQRIYNATLVNGQANQFLKSQRQTQQTINLEHQKMMSQYQDTQNIQFMKSPDQQNLAKLISTKLNEKAGLQTVPILKHLNQKQDEGLEQHISRQQNAVLLQDQSHVQRPLSSLRLQSSNQKTFIRQQFHQNSKDNQEYTTLTNQQILNSREQAGSSRVRIRLPKPVVPSQKNIVQKKVIALNHQQKQPTYTIKQQVEIGAVDDNSSPMLLVKNNPSFNQFKLTGLKSPKNDDVAPSPQKQLNQQEKRSNSLPMSKSIIINNKIVHNSFNRYNADLMSAENFDSAYYQPQLIENLYQLEDSSQVVPKYGMRLQKESDASKPTAATSNQNYLIHFDGDFQSPKGAVKISNQNALLSLMSHDDLEGIKNQIHSRINKIEEAKEEEDEGEDRDRKIQFSKGEDDEGQVIQERLRSRRTTVL